MSRRPKRFAITARWSRKERALVYDGCRWTAPLLAGYIECRHEPPRYDGRSLAEELDARGYDLTTLRITIQPKSTGGLLPQGATSRLAAALCEAIDPWFLTTHRAAEAQKDNIDGRRDP